MADWLFDRLLGVHEEPPPTEPAPVHLRMLAKNAAFGLLYGGSRAVIERAVPVEANEAGRLVAGFLENRDQRWPRITSATSTPEEESGARLDEVMRLLNLIGP